MAILEELAGGLVADLALQESWVSVSFEHVSTQPGNGLIVVKWWLNGGLMGCYGIYPLVKW